MLGGGWGKDCRVKTAGCADGRSLAGEEAKEEEEEKEEGASEGDNEAGKSDGKSGKDGVGAGMILDFCGLMELGIVCEKSCWVGRIELWGRDEATLGPRDEVKAADVAVAADSPDFDADAGARLPTKGRRTCGFPTSAVTLSGPVAVSAEEDEDKDDDEDDNDEDDDEGRGGREGVEVNEARGRPTEGTSLDGVCWSSVFGRTGVSDEAATGKGIESFGVKARCPSKPGVAAASEGIVGLG